MPDPDPKELSHKSGVLIRPTANSALSAKPDKPWQFQPGQSGNPTGRPKSKIISDALRLELERIQASGASGAEALAARAMLEAVGKGNVHAMTFVRDTTEGKPMQMIKVEQSMDESTALRLEELARTLLPQAEYE